MTREIFEKAEEFLSAIVSLEKTIEDIEELLKEEGKFYMDLTLIHPITSGKNNERAEDFYVPREDLQSIFCLTYENAWQKKKNNSQNYEHKGIP